METWSDFFELSKNKPPNRVLEAAIKLVVERGHALDLGAGSLKDSKFMLSMGFKKVTATDADPAIRKYRDKIPASLLALKVSPFETLKLKPNSYNFISAQNSLPFTAPPHLPPLLNQIIASLKPNGIFCCRVFGPKDSWNIPENKKSMTFVTKAELKKLLAPLELIMFEEEIKDSKTIDGQMKTWQDIDVIAIKSFKTK